MDIKLYSKIYKELKKYIQQVKNNKEFSNYEKWCKSRAYIDDFYSKDILSDSIIYERYMNLKKKTDIFKNINIPILITVVFGISTTWSISVFSFIKNNFMNFMDNMDKIHEDAIAKLLDPSNIVRVSLLHDQILTETQKSMMVISLWILFCLLIIVIALISIFQIILISQQFKFEVYEYELSKIKYILREREMKKKNEKLDLEELPQYFPNLKVEKLNQRNKNTLD